MFVSAIAVIVPVYSKFENSQDSEVRLHYRYTSATSSLLRSVYRWDIRVVDLSLAFAITVLVLAETRFESAHAMAQVWCLICRRHGNARRRMCTMCSKDGRKVGTLKTVVDMPPDVNAGGNTAGNSSTQFEGWKRKGKRKGNI